LVDFASHATVPRFLVLSVLILAEKKLFALEVLMAGPEK
jgi:hypothetical protein